MRAHVRIDFIITPTFFFQKFKTKTGLISNIIDSNRIGESLSTYKPTDELVVIDTKANQPTHCISHQSEHRVIADVRVDQIAPVDLGIWNEGKDLARFGSITVSVLRERHSRCSW